MSLCYLSLLLHFWGVNRQAVAAPFVYGRVNIIFLYFSKILLKKLKMTQWLNEKRKKNKNNHNNNSMTHKDLQLEAVASYAHLAELMSLLREIGNGFALVQLLDAALVEVQVMHAPQAAGVSQTAIDAFGNVAARDGTLRSSLMGAVSQNFRWIGSERTGDGAEEEEKALLEAAWHFADGGTPPSSKPPPLLPPGSEGGGRRVLLPRFLRAVRHAVADVHAPYALAFPPDPSSTRELHGVLGAVLFCFCADVFVPGASSHPTACAAYWEAYGDGVWLGACLLLFCSGQGERFLSGNVLQDVLASHARHRSHGSAPASATSHLLQRSRACLDGIARHLPSLRPS